MSNGRPPTHGGSKTREYIIWSQMRVRCRSSKHPYWHRYGGRGIAVCERWDQSFSAFLADKGKAPSRLHTLDRIDSNGNYSLENCRWATRREQARNTRANRLLTHLGETMSLAEWAERADMPYLRLRDRLRRGWTVERALTEPRLSRW